MKLLSTTFGRLLDPTRRLFQRARRGSVLILVIALLVLLALMGTAYISTARTERYSSAQHISNTQADLLLQGVENAVQANLSVELYGSPAANSAAPGTAFRPASQEMPTAVAPATGLLTYNYDNYTSDNDPNAGSTNDLMLAARIPFATDATTDTSGQIPVGWGNISWPLMPDTSGNFVFDSPFESGTNEAPVSLWGSINRGRVQFYPSYKYENGTAYPGMIIYAPNAGTYSVTTSTGATPGTGFITPYQTGALGTGTMPVPGFQTAQPNGGDVQQYTVFAADADGDGIADSALWKLPISPIDGVTYYAAVRVVDNNSAINASTAWTSTTDYQASMTLPATAGTTYTSTNSLMNFGFFRSSVGLVETLNLAAGPAEMNNLLNYRSNTTASPINYTAAYTAGTIPTPVADADSWQSAPYSRKDFSYFSYGEMFEQQLARRLANPGYIYCSPNPVTQFQSLTLGDSASLADRFCLRSTSTAESTLESLLPVELYNSARTTPYAATNISGSNGTWFNDLFNFGTSGSPAEPTYPSLRSLLVARNGASNGIPTRYGNFGSGLQQWNPSNTYAFGDIVGGITYSNTGVISGSDGYAYVCLQNGTTALGTVLDPHNPSYTPNPAGSANPPSPNPPATTVMGQPAVPATANTPPTPAIYENQYWARVPFTSLASKVSVNTATFDQLWLGFCQVMADTSSVAVTVSGGNTVRAATWNPPITAAAAAGNAPSNGVEKQLPMFRSVIRDNRAQPGQGTLLTPMQMLQLRAAIAAVNTLDMRDTDNDVTSRHVVLSDPTAGAIPYDAEVYGTEPQPFISEVFANVDATTPANDYVAIELVNPYPVPITITPQWAFATLGRPTTAGTAPPQLTFQSVMTVPTNLIIPAATNNKPQYVYLVGGTAPGGTFNAPTGAVAPAGTAGATLANALTDNSGNSELVILKPRLSSGSFSASTDAKDSYQEQNTGGGTPNPYDMVPVDQIDFSGMAALSPAKPFWAHYRRADAPSTAAPSYAWNFVYPGPYYPDPGAGAGAPSGPGGGNPPAITPSVSAAEAPVYAVRQAFEIDTAETDTGGFTQLKQGPPAVYATGGAIVPPTFYTAPIQLNNANMAGFNAPIASNNAGKNLVNNLPTPPNQFPFGGFARNGDLLQIPFIGAYTLRAQVVGESDTEVTEMNSVSMDSAYAFDDSTLLAGAAKTNPATGGGTEIVPQGATGNLPQASLNTAAVAENFFEQIGRFCPVGISGDPTTAATMDFKEPASAADAATPATWHYHWARKLFDYFTVQAPADDYFPNVDPTPMNGGTNGTAISPAIFAKYPDASGIPTLQPQGTANRKSSVVNSSGNGSEDTVGVEGLININTAPWPVLAQLPFVPKGTDYINFFMSSTVGIGTGSAYEGTASLNSNGGGTGSADGIDDNVNIAQAIVAYRNANGPFKTIFDLYKVPAFALENDALWNQQVTAEPVPKEGYFIANRPDPNGPTGGITSWSAATGSDSPRLDFAERFLLLNHVSNLITTRSDSFTCYVLLQGWRGVGTGAPTLAVQRRGAFILDRTGITPSSTNSTASTFPVPTN